MIILLIEEDCNYYNIRKDMKAIVDKTNNKKEVNENEINTSYQSICRMIRYMRSHRRKRRERIRQRNLPE